MATLPTRIDESPAVKPGLFKFEIETYWAGSETG